jgi:hypothetical protein
MRMVGYFGLRLSGNINADTQIQRLPYFIASRTFFSDAYASNPQYKCLDLERHFYLLALDRQNAIRYL